MIEKPIVSGLLIFLIITVIWCLYKHQLFFNDQKQTQKSDKSESKDDEHSDMSGLSFALSGSSQGPSICPDKGYDNTMFPFKEIDCTDIKTPKCVYFSSNRYGNKGTQLMEYVPDAKAPFIEYCFNQNPDTTPITGPTVCPDEDADGNKFNYPFKEVVCVEEIPFRPTKCRYYSLEANDEEEGPITINDFQTAKTLIADCFKRQTITGHNAICEEILPAKVDHTYEGFWCDITQQCRDVLVQRESLNYTLTNVAVSKMEFDVIGNNGTLAHDGYCRNNVLLLVPDGDANNWYSLFGSVYLQADVGGIPGMAGWIYYWEAGSWNQKKQTGFFLE